MKEKQSGKSPHYMKKGTDNTGVKGRKMKH